MAAWNDVIYSAPEFAAMVQTLFDAHRNKLLATLRKDGSPRISAVEVDFVGGDLWLGMMFGSRKAHDLQRDPRFALHSASTTPDDDDPSKWPGDAKLSGLAVEITDSSQAKRLAPSPSGQSHLFRADIHEVVLTKIGDSADHLVIELWRENRGLRRFKRH